MRVQLIDQFILYIVQQGLTLLGQLDWISSSDIVELLILKRRFCGFLKALVEHDLVSCLFPFISSLLALDALSILHLFD